MNISLILPIFFNSFYYYWIIFLDINFSFIVKKLENHKNQ